MATPPTFVPTATVVGGSSTGPLDGQQADPNSTYLRVMVPSAKGAIEQFIRLADLTAYISAVAKGQ